MNELNYPLLGIALTTSRSFLSDGFRFRRTLRSGLTENIMLRPLPSARIAYAAAAAAGLPFTATNHA